MPHELKARTQGRPSIGSGAIYPVPEEDILCDPFEFPAWYRHCYALDVGWNRTAALWLAYSQEDDTAYAYAEYYRGSAEPPVHAAAIKARGDWIPGTVDPASRGRSQADGAALFNQYTDLGLVLAPANNAREAGIYEVWSRLSTGRIKVFKTLQNFRGEYGIYRRDEKGSVVKAGDHLMDCLRYGIMTGISLAIIRPFDQWAGRPGMPPKFAKKQGLESAYSPYSQAWSIGKIQHSQQPTGWFPGGQSPLKKN